MRMQKFTCYAVYKGIDPDTDKKVMKQIYATWDEAKKYVVHVDGSRYKGFNSKKEARLWFDMLDRMKDKDNDLSVDSPLIDICRAYKHNAEAIFAILKETGNAKKGAADENE